MNHSYPKSFEFISAHSGRWGGPETVIGGNEPVRAYVVSVYRDSFNVFDVAPMMAARFRRKTRATRTVKVAVVSNGF